MSSPQGGCDPRLVEKAQKLVLEALKGYLRANCKRIVSLARLAGQSRVKMEMHGVYKYYSGDEELPRFVSAFAVLLRCLGEDVHRILGGRVRISEGGEPLYVELSVDAVDTVCREG